MDLLLHLTLNEVPLDNKNIYFINLPKILECIDSNDLNESTHTGQFLVPICMRLVQPSLYDDVPVFLLAFRFFLVQAYLRVPEKYKKHKSIKTSSFKWNRVNRANTYFKKVHKVSDTKVTAGFLLVR